METVVLGKECNIYKASVRIASLDLSMNQLLLTLQIKESQTTWHCGLSMGFVFLISSVDYSKSIYMTFTHEIHVLELRIETSVYDPGSF